MDTFTWHTIVSTCTCCLHTNHIDQLLIEKPWYQPKNLQAGYLRWLHYFPKQSNWWKSVPIHFIIRAYSFQLVPCRFSRKRFQILFFNKATECMPKKMFFWGRNNKSYSNHKIGINVIHPGQSLLLLLAIHKRHLIL